MFGHATICGPSTDICAFQSHIIVQLIKSVPAPANHSSTGLMLLLCPSPVLAPSSLLCRLALAAFFPLLALAFVARGLAANDPRRHTHTHTRARARTHTNTHTHTQTRTTRPLRTTGTEPLFNCQCPFLMSSGTKSSRLPGHETLAARSMSKVERRCHCACSPLSDVLVLIDRRPHLGFLLVAQPDTVRVAVVPVADDLAWGPPVFGAGLDGVAHLEPKLPGHHARLEAVDQRFLVEIPAQPMRRPNKREHALSEAATARAWLHGTPRLFWQVTPNALSRSQTPSHVRLHAAEAKRDMLPALALWRFGALADRPANEDKETFALVVRQHAVSVPVAFVHAREQHADSLQQRRRRGGGEQGRLHEERRKRRRSQQPAASDRGPRGHGGQGTRRWFGSAE